MASVNINSSVQDAFYRYKMPRLLAKVEGKGNGIKTVIANMSDIAKALNRPPTYATKYFGCELGAQTQFDFKNDRYIVNGEHDAQKLQDLLNGFIKKFVLCPGCDNPETTLTVKRGQILQACKACGYSGTVSQKHRLSTYIMKNPPTAENGAEPATEKVKKVKNGTTTKTKKGGDSSPTGEDQNGDEVGLAGEGIETEHQNGHTNGSSGSDDDDDWATDLHDADQLPDAMRAITMNPDLEKSLDERLDMFYSYLMKAKEAGTEMDGKAIVTEAERLDIKDKAPLLICRVMLDGATDIVTQLKSVRPLLLRVVNANKKAQRYLLGGLEQLIVANKDIQLPKTAHILKCLYDGDLVEEEVLLEWGAKPSKKYVKKEECKEVLAKAEPFLKWLKEAEEESEEESEGEDEVEFTDAPVKKGTPGGDVENAADAKRQRTP